MCVSRVCVCPRALGILLSLGILLNPEDGDGGRTGVLGLVL